MPEINNEAEKTYSTGELAALCGVSVRTVQYYDEKGLLPPSGLTEGGRRIYTEADTAKLRRIMVLKSLGLKLADIRDFLGSNASAVVLRDILEEQDRRLAKELEERTEARRRIASMIDSLNRTGDLPAETIPDMEDAMQKVSMRESELWPFYRMLIVISIPIGITEITTIAWWIATGNWRPFAIAMAIVAVYSIVFVRIYRKKTAYVCPHCRSVFAPRGFDWFFATHTPTTRKVTCTHCGTKDWCAEVSSERLDDKRP